MSPDGRQAERPLALRSRPGEFLIFESASSYLGCSYVAQRVLTLISDVSAEVFFLRREHGHPASVCAMQRAGRSSSAP